MVTNLLEQAGHRVTQVEDGPLDQERGDVVLTLGNVSWFRKIYGQLAARDPSRRPLTVAWQSEALPPPRAAGLPRPRLQLRELAKIGLRDARAGDVYTNHRRLRSLDRRGLPDLLVVSSRVGQEFLAERSIQAEWEPFGFHPSYGRDMELDRDIDVLFLGTMKSRRRRRLIARIRRAGVDLRALGSWHDPGLWGEARTRLLNRTKVILNIARLPGQFSGLRLMLGMANRSLVVSEPIYRPEPYLPGKHFVVAELADLPEVVAHELTHLEARRQMVDDANHLVTREITLENSVRRLLALIESKLDVP